MLQGARCFNELNSSNTLWLQHVISMDMNMLKGYTATNAIKYFYTNSTSRMNRYYIIFICSNERLQTVIWYNVIYNYQVQMNRNLYVIFQHVLCFMKMRTEMLIYMLLCRIDRAQYKFLK